MTTRDDRNTYTSERALLERRAPDGGFYIPYRIPELSREELSSLRRMAPNERVRFVAGRFLRLPDRLFDPDITFVRSSPLGNRITVCDLFPGDKASFHECISYMAGCLGLPDRADPVWLAVAIRTGAMVFAIVELMHANERFDISVVSGDMYAPLSAYLCRRMGLPVGDILCCCNENSGFWELLDHGTFRTDRIAVRSDIPEADIVIPDGLECLIALCCGREEAVRYIEAVRTGSPYMPGEEEYQRLSSAFRSVVVTGDGILRGAYASRGVPIGKGTALALAGLLDYRARNRAGRNALVIAE